MIDTHCHLTYDPLHAQVDAVVERASVAGVDRMISVGTTPDDADHAVALTERFDGVYATVGVHPHYAAKWPDRQAVVNAMHDLASHDRVVALGEMGLDKHYPDPPMTDQRRVFEWQLGVMHELPDLPGIVHNREATDDVIAMIRASAVDGTRFVFHCFTGKPKEIDRILDLGAMVSFTGIVTFDSAKHVAEASDRVPIERLMIETDSPFLTPAPHRKVRPNEPRFVPYVAEFLARRRGMPVAEFTGAADANAARFFGLRAAGHGRPG